MISPLGQRQVFQTANVEAVRQAQEVSELIQREQAKKQAVDDRLLEDQASVRLVAESEHIQTSERQGGRGPEQGTPGKAGTQEETKPGEEPAESADSHLNFLA